MEISVQNLVVSANFMFRPDLQKIANLYNKICKYNRHKFCGLILKLNRPKCSVTIYRTGKVVILGTKKLSCADKGFRKVEKMMKQCGYNTFITDVQLKNMTVNGCFPFELSPTKLKEWGESKIYYEPELFPAIRYMVPDSKIIITMFCNGKWYACGGKDIEVYKNILYPMYLEFELLFNL